MKLLITGGHLTPALSLMDYAIKNGDEIIFIGRQYSSQQHHLESHEKAEVENRGGVFVSFDTIKLNRHQKLRSLITLPKILPAIVRAISHLNAYKPDVVISFGGYLALPVTIAAKLKGIPIFTHEQTHIIGLANQIIMRIADAIGISWSSTKGNFPKSKVTVTGNPIRYELKASTPKPDWVTSDRPIIYITGGSQGARAINQAIIASIPQLSKEYYCIHQTGNQADFDAASLCKVSLSPEQKQNYTVSNWYSAQEVSWILSQAVVAVGRSGANTITELMYKNVPAVLIPLPYAGANEQLLNAQAIADQEGGILLPQSNLNPESLLQAIRKIIQNQQQYQQNLQHISQHLKNNPEETIYQIVKKLYENKHPKTPQSA